MKNMIPTYPAFTPIDYSLIEELQNIITTNDPLMSEFSLGIFYGYRKDMDIRLTKVSANLCVLSRINEDLCFLSPLGSNDIPQTIAVCMKHLYNNFGRGSIYCIDKKHIEVLKELGFNPLPDKDNFDYVYKVKDMAELSGQRFQAKRNFVNGFLKSNKYEYLKLTSEHVKECKGFQEAWCKVKRCKEDMNLIAEDYAVSELLDNFARLNMFGGVIKINGVIQGFSIGEKLNSNTAVIHIEKANSSIRGLYQALNNIFCKNELLGKFEFVNREQDMGDEGLRKAKLSYHPAFMVEKYKIEIQR